MGEIALILVLVFVILLVLNVPIAIAIGMAAYLAIVAEGKDPNVMMASRMANGVNSFALLAIPFFILSGLFMGRGGMARRLIDFAAVLVGRFPGGLAYVNTLTCMLFGSISGSAAAAVSSVGGFMIPEMNRKGFGREFNVAVTTTAATTGLLIPPSNIMIVYSVAAGSVSIAAMFMAGVLAGVIVGLFIMIICAVICFRSGYGGGEAVRFNPADLNFILHSRIGPFRNLGEKLLGYCRSHPRFAVSLTFCLKFFSAVPALLLIVIVIGGILAGIFTATEAAAVAVLYSFIVTVLIYREITLKDIPEIFRQTGITTAVVMFLIGASQGMSWIMTITNIPQSVSNALVNLSENPVVILLSINLLLLFVGTFMDMTPAVLIFTPIFLPVVTSLGMHPIHFGIMMIANLCIGLCTPPVGTCLFIGCGVGQTTIAKVARTMLPFFGAMVLALMVITYVPPVTLWLPVQTKQIKPDEVQAAYDQWQQQFFNGSDQPEETLESQKEPDHEN